MILGVIGLIDCVLALVMGFGGDGVSVALVLGGVVGIIANAMLICGVKKQNHSYLLVWMVMSVINMIGLIVGTGMLIWAAVVLAAHEVPATEEGGVGPSILTAMSVVLGITTCLEVYFYIVVFSYYKELKKTGNRGITKA
jgi:peptidoglycan biosynthesis protein MviN/MurJ (putative lipid II flippase)